MVDTHTSKRIPWSAVALAVILAVFTLLMVSRNFVQASDGHSSEWRGIVQAKPAEGRLGTWKIGGKFFEVTVRTRFDQENGLLSVNSCAQVEYRKVGDVNQALQIESKHARGCPGATIPPTPQPTPAPVCGDDVSAQQDGGGKDCKVVGHLTALPDQGFVGTWGIDDVNYTVDLDTKLRAEHGMFVLNACVTAQYKEQNSEKVLKEIRTTNAYRCDGDTDNQGRHEGELYGIIESFPLSATGVLTGEWTIGGKVFVADSNTQFVQEKVDFAEGVMVKVKFWTDVNGVNYAMKIESKFRPQGKGEDHDGHGSHEGAEGMAAGKVITMPETQIGVWVIGDVEYTVSDKTELKEQRGAIGVGTLVRVRYHLDSNGGRLADMIKTIAPAGEPNEYENAHLVGSVDVMPTDGFSGTWQIANVTFETNADSRFVEDRGVLAVGAYVRVEYVVVDGVNVIVEVKTLCPPGAGDKDDTGTIEQNDDGLVAAGVTANGTWVIGGSTYIVTDGTILDSGVSSLDVGSTVQVNSYTAADGSLVATKIQGVEAVRKVFLPTISR